MVGTRALVATALLATAVAAFEESDSGVLEHVRAAGGFVGFKIGKDCEGCIRGAFAAQDYDAGTLIARIPAAACLELGVYWDASSELAKLLAEPSFNTTWGVPWNALPGPEEVISIESLTEELVTELQTTQLAQTISTLRNSFQQKWERLPFKIRAGKITKDYFMYLASLISTRGFNVLEAGVDQKWLVPALDMLNHQTDSNAEWEWVPAEEGKLGVGNFEAKLTKAVKSGDELTLSYVGGSRKDISFFAYGFTDTAKIPSLCAMDLSTWEERNPFTEPEEDDETIYGELHDTEIRQETLRVAQRLKLLPTTEAQDQKALKALLDAAAAGGAEAARAAWRKEQVVRFRIQRKRALMHRLSLLEDQLDDLEGL